MRHNRCLLYKPVPKALRCPPYKRRKYPIPRLWPTPTTFSKKHLFCPKPYRDPHKEYWFEIFVVLPFDGSYPPSLVMQSICLFLKKRGLLCLYKFQPRKKRHGPTLPSGVSSLRPQKNTPWIRYMVLGGNRRFGRDKSRDFSCKTRGYTHLLPRIPFKRISLHCSYRPPVLPLPATSYPQCPLHLYRLCPTHPHRPLADEITPSTTGWTYFPLENLKIRHTPCATYRPRTMFTRLKRYRNDRTAQTNCPTGQLTSLQNSFAAHFAVSSLPTYASQRPSPKSRKR